MSFIHFLGLDDPGYGNFAKGILYVIYEILWNIVYAVGKLVDSLTGIFYKLAGLDYLGSGSETLVEEKDLLSQIFNQNIISNVSLFMILASITLMAVFGGIAVLKRLYFSKGEAKSTVDIIKNMVVATIFLIFLTPLALFVISTISTVTTLVASAFGSDMNVSLADAMFRTSFSGDPIEAYNVIYGTGVSEWTDITSWVEIKNSGFLFDLKYSGLVDTEFYWYIYLLGGGVVLFNIVVLSFRLVKRLFNIVVLYLIGPVYVAKMVDDGGVKFKEWKNKAVAELVSIIGTVVGFMILLSLVGMIDGLEIIETASDPGVSGEIGVLAMAEENVVQNSNVLLINNLARMLLLMAGTAVAKDSGELLGNLFKTQNEESVGLLEGIYEKLSKSNKSTSTTTNAAPKTRVITKNTTTTRRIIDYSESIPAPSADGQKNTITNNQTNTFNTSVNNTDNRTVNLQNRTNVSLNGTNVVPREGIKTGAYREKIGRAHV